MIGIIYKFTIIAKYKMNGNKPFYIGQHIGIDSFNNYWGSGTIWNDFLNRLKANYPKHWQKFIKREILYNHECNQKALDKLEEYYIKKFKAHYSYGLGGCNVLWGTANDFGSGSPMKDPKIRKMRSEYMKEYYKTHKHPSSGKKFSKETKRKLSKSHKGQRHSPEVIERIRNKNLGKKRSPEFCERMREIWKERKESGWVSPNRGRSVSDEIKEKRAEGVRRYYKTHDGTFLGKHHTEEFKKMMSDKMKGKYVGKTLSEETRRKMSKSITEWWTKRKQSYSLKQD